MVPPAEALDLMVQVGRQEAPPEETSDGGGPGPVGGEGRGGA